MRALLTMLLVTTMGCESYWAGYLTTATADNDGGTGGPACTMPQGCDDLMSPSPPEVDDAGVPLLVCTNSAMFPASAAYCDQNTGLCTAIVPPSEAFLSESSSIKLNKPYTLMATGDFNADGLVDVAVSGGWRWFIWERQPTGERLPSGRS